MGTSSGYDMPSGEQWEDLRHDLDKFLEKVIENAAKRLVDEAAKRMFRSYVRANGGAKVVAKGEVSDADGRKARIPSAACKASAVIGKAVTVAASGGHAAAISQDLLQPAEPARTLDEYAARQAVLDILDDLPRLTDPSKILGKFFGAYLYYRFSRDSYELCVEKRGVRDTLESLQKVKKYIEDFAQATLNNQLLLGADWEHNGDSLSERIFTGILEGLEK